MKKYQEYLVRKNIEFGDKFNDKKLSSKFIPYYENEQRIEVKFHYGETKRGTVGVTTGWQPVFLLMLTKRSAGSSYTLNNKDKITKIIS